MSNLRANDRPDIEDVIPWPTRIPSDLQAVGAFAAGLVAVLAVPLLLALPSGSLATQPPISAQAEAGALGISPRSLTVQQGEIATVTVWLTDVADYYGLDFRLGFDPGVVTAAQVMPAWEVFDASDHFIVKNEIDNASGEIWYAVSNLNPAEAFTGTGHVCSITFQAHTAGTTTLHTHDAQGATRDGVSLAPAPVDGQIEVRTLAPTMTPSFAIKNTPYAVQTYTLTINNEAASADTFCVRHAATDTSSLSGSGLQVDWGVLSSTHTLDVGAGLSENLRITVQVPTFETTWVTHTLHLTATSITYPDRHLTSTLHTHTGGEWDPVDGRWERCRFDYYGVGTVYFGDAQLVYDRISSSDARFRNYHVSTVYFGDAQLVYDHIGQGCAP